jgi:hypothetical protein
VTSAAHRYVHCYISPRAQQQYVAAAVVVQGNSSAASIGELYRLWQRRASVAQHISGAWQHLSERDRAR